MRLKIWNLSKVKVSAEILNVQFEVGFPYALKIHQNVILHEMDLEVENFHKLLNKKDEEQKRMLIMKKMVIILMNYSHFSYQIMSHGEF